MRKCILFAIIAGLLLIPSRALGEISTVSIPSDTVAAELAGSDVGNIPSFQIKFALDSVDSTLPTNAVIQTATIVYTQAGVSGGLLRIIDKYSADVIDSKSMATAGQYEITSALSYVRQWFSLPSHNLGLLFQSSAMNATDLLTFGQMELHIEYTMPDLTPPSLDGDIIVEVGTSTAKIYVISNEPTFVNINYGRTSNYGQTFVTDNIEPTINNLILLENLTSGSTYHYMVKMKDAANNLASTLDLTFDTLTDFDITGSKPVDQSLKAPQELHVDNVYIYGKAQASLSWNPSNEAGIKGYIIYRADDVTKKFTEYVTLDIKTNTYMDTAVNLGKTYYYYVRSFSDLVISPKSEEKSATFPTTIPDQIPEQPPTTQTFLITLAAASLVIFAIYIIAKIVQKEEERKSKRLRNVLKDPEHYM